MKSIICIFLRNNYFVICKTQLANVPTQNFLTPLYISKKNEAVKLHYTSQIWSNSHETREYNILGIIYWSW